MALALDMFDEEPASPSDPQAFVTLGSWASEEMSGMEFDRRIAATGLFRVYEQVTGTLTQPRPGQIDKGMRIDRVLFPEPALKEAGWDLGAIGVELKRSGARIGKPLAQATDYVRTSWLLPRSGGVLFEISSAFLWPVGEQYGPVASYMVHQRVGSVGFSDPYTLIHFRLGHQTVLRVRPDKSFDVGQQAPQSGRKSGNRG